jgi:peroxiredoxin
VIEEGKPARDFELESDSGEKVKLSAFRGTADRPLLLSQVGLAGH